MKKILILCLLFFSPFPLYAADNVPVETVEEEVTSDVVSQQDEEVEIDPYTKQVFNKYFDLTLEQKPQSGFNKTVPYVLTITPHIDSPKTQILWNTPTTLSANPRHAEFVDLNEGETYTFKGIIKPLRSGLYEFSVSVISWQYDTNYTNTIDDSLAIDRNLVLQPVSQEYTMLSILKYVLILLVFVALSFVAVVVVKRNMVKAKKWLTPPY